MDFATKTSYTFKAALKILDEKQHYKFTILKDLTQVPSEKDLPKPSKMTPLDFDQMLFFKVGRITIRASTQLNYSHFFLFSLIYPIFES